METHLRALAGVLMMAALVSGQQSKPVKSAVVREHRMDAPSSASEMTAAANAVIIADYVGPARVVPDSHHPNILVTVHQFRIVEIIKLHQELPFVGNIVELDIVGGEVEFASYSYRVRNVDMAEWQRDVRYVLFLGWDVRLQKFALPWGPSAAYAIGDDKVRSLNALQRTPHDGQPVETFVRGVRSGK